MNHDNFLHTLNTQQILFRLILSGFFVLAVNPAFGKDWNDPDPMNPYPMMPVLRKIADNLNIHAYHAWGWGEQSISDVVEFGKDHDCSDWERFTHTHKSPYYFSVQSLINKHPHLECDTIVNWVKNYKTASVHACSDALSAGIKAGYTTTDMPKDIKNFNAKTCDAFASMVSVEKWTPKAAVQALKTLNKQQLATARELVKQQWLRHINFRCLYLNGQNYCEEAIEQAKNKIPFAFF